MVVAIAEVVMVVVVVVEDGAEEVGEATVTIECLISGEVFVLSIGAPPRSNTSRRTSTLKISVSLPAVSEKWTSSAAPRK